MAADTILGAHFLSAMARNTTGNDPALGAAIRRLREGQGLSQEETAYRAGLTAGAYQRIEAGRADARWTSVRAIAKALGVSLRELAAAVEARA